MLGGPCYCCLGDFLHFYKVHFVNGNLYMCVCICMCVPQCALNNNLQKFVLLLYHLVELRSGLAWWQTAYPVTLKTVLKHILTV